MDELSTTRVPTTRRPFIIIMLIYSLILAFVLFWITQILEIFTQSAEIKNSKFFLFSLFFPIIMLVLTSINITRVITQLNAGIKGSLLRLKLSAFFILIIFLTALPQTFLSSLTLRTITDLWLAPNNEEALASGKNLGQIVYDNSLENLAVIASSPFFHTLFNEENFDPKEIWARLSQAYPSLDSLQIFEPTLARHFGTPLGFISLEDLTLHRLTGPLPRPPDEDRTVISWQAVLQDRRVLLSTVMHEGFSRELFIIEESLENWRRYDHLGKSMGGSLLIFWIFFAGPLLLISLFAAITFSDWIIRPLIKLSEATAKIAEGQFDFRIPFSKKDEFGFLALSFNRMIGELDVNRKKTIQTEKVGAWQSIARRLAHELRNPLTPIKLSAQRVSHKTNDTSPLDKEMINKSMMLILNEVEALDKLLQDFQEFAGGVMPKMQPLILRQVVVETLKRFHAVAPEIDWQLLPGKDDPTLPADALQLRQVLINLLQNAQEAKAKHVSIRINFVQKGRIPQVRLEIQDDGEGIPTERAAKVFEPYESTRNRGSGLGLPVVQRIIDSHHGRIWFTSEANSGTIFYIDLPSGGTDEPYSHH